MVNFILGNMLVKLLINIFHTSRYYFDVQLFWLILNIILFDYASVEKKADFFKCSFIHGHFDIW